MKPCAMCGRSTFEQTAMAHNRAALPAIFRGEMTGASTNRPRR
jgi:hypothetical protein